MNAAANPKDDKFEARITDVLKSYGLKILICESRSNGMPIISEEYDLAKSEEYDLAKSLLELFKPEKVEFQDGIQPPDIIANYLECIYVIEITRGGKINSDIDKLIPKFLKIKRKFAKGYGGEYFVFALVFTNMYAHTIFAPKTDHQVNVISREALEKLEANEDKKSQKFINIINGLE